MTHSSSSQSGSAFFMILIAVSLFAALSYAVSQQRDSGAALSTEKTRLLATEVMDMGNKFADTFAQLRLRRISNTKISFENSVVNGYANPACSDDLCKIFAGEGGGKDWERPVAEINGGVDWGFTGDVAVQEIGSTEAELVALVPNLSLQICNRINTMLGLYGSTVTTPPLIAGLIANQFTGTYAVVPFALSDSVIKGRKSGCIGLTTPSGSVFRAALNNPSYTYYHVLDER